VKPIPIFTPNKNYETRFKTHRPRKPEDRLDLFYHEDPLDNAALAHSDDLAAILQLQAKPQWLLPARSVRDAR